MAKKKSELDVVKGFKRIFYVAATIWGLFLLIYALVRWDKCVPYPGWVPPPDCEDMTLTGLLIMTMIIFLITTIIAYYFLRWIGAGFKNK